MKYTEVRLGRVFIIRLEDKDILPACIEQFAKDNGITIAQAILIGGIGAGQVVVGPRLSDAMPPEPMLQKIDGAHEVVGLGLIVPDEAGKPILHMHAALGRSGTTITGCIRPGVSTWLVGEVIIYEIIGADVRRTVDNNSGFSLLDIK